MVRLISRFSIVLFMAAFVLGLASTPAQASGEATTISIPSIDVEAAVVPVELRAFEDGSVTWDVSALHMDVGLFTGLSNFGQRGNTVVGGHSEDAGGAPDIFYNLDDIDIGAEITVHDSGQVFRYEVVDNYRASFTDLTPVLPTSDERLTLITCDIGSYNSSSGNYSQRVVVVATRIR